MPSRAHGARLSFPSPPTNGELRDSRLRGSEKIERPVNLLQVMLAKGSPPVRALIPLLLLVSSLPARAAAPPPLVIYTYDSFMAKDGLGPAIIPTFEKKCGCQVKALPSGDGAQLLTRVQLDSERGKPGAALVVGIDQAIWPKLKAYVDASDPWKPSADADILPQARVDAGFVPYDFGVLALMVDSTMMASLKLAPPARVEDLMRPEYRRNFVLEDPRTSTPGLAFVLFASQLLAEKAPAFWSSLKTQWLTLAPGWDVAYGLFLKGEAPMVWSYTTSQAYHEEHGQERYRAVVFDDGNPAQVEGAALLKGHSPAEVAVARQFLEYLMSPEVQEQIPKRNWMFPARGRIQLPMSFAHLPVPKHVLREQYGGEYVTAALADWTRAVSAP